MEKLENFPDILEESIDDGELDASGIECPICQEDVIINGRCKTCYICGWSSCDL